MLVEIRQEAARMDRSLSWVVQRAWKVGKKDVREIPTDFTLDPDSDSDSDIEAPPKPEP